MSETDIPRRGFRKKGGRFALALIAAGMVLLATWPASRRPVGEELSTIDIGLDAGSGFTISPDGRTVATPDLRTIWPWELPHPPGHRPDQADHQGIVQFWDVATGKAGPSFSLDPRAEAEDVRPILFSPDGSTLVAGNWIGPGGPRISTPSLPHYPVFRVWSIHSGKVMATFPVPSGYGRQLVFSSDGKTLTASIAAASGVEQVLRWDTSDWHQISDISLSDSGVNSTAIAPAGDLIAVASFKDAIIRLHDLPSGHVRSSLEQPALRGSFKSFVELLFSPDGKTLAALLGDNTVQFWDVATGTLGSSFVPKKDEQYQFHMAFSPDGRSLALGSPFVINDGMVDRLNRWVGPFLGFQPRPLEIVGQIRLVDVATGKRSKSFEIPQPYMTSLSFTPDGHGLTTSGPDISVPHESGVCPPRLIFWRLAPDL